MSDVWRIFVVEGNEALNQNVINSLRKDGYIVQGVTNGADALRILWAEEYDVVLCDLKTPGTDGFELLQWLRAAHPNTRMILIEGPASSIMRMQALESGASGYLEKPLDLHLLKEELRRLLQQTGFSANLESFDLLDVIQIITMSRKSIALLVNTGLEERGLLCFKGGDLAWAEYGLLRGEEAFFALAAHKNGTVMHQAWNEQAISNVTQPLSRLIFQALQYRSKYAQPFSAEHLPITASAQLSGALAPVTDNGDGRFTIGNEDDTPFGMVAEPLDRHDTPFAAQPPMSASEKEWWERTGSFPRLEDGSDIANIGAMGNIGHTNGLDAPSSSDIEAILPGAIDGLISGMITPATVYKTTASQRTDLPSWLTDQPTASDLPAIRPANESIPATPRVRPSSPEWMPPSSPNGSDQEQTAARKPVAASLHRRRLSGAQKPLPADSAVRQAASPEWQPSEPMSPSLSRSNGNLQTFTHNTLDVADVQDSSSHEIVMNSTYNYTALVSALQTLGYSIPGFVAAAVVSMDGQTVAQVAVDDLDISRICKYFSEQLKNTLQALNQGMWGDYKDTVIASSDRYILMRIIGANAFQVLITTREADATESLQVMINVEGAISAALFS